jgi:hypothetical protein
LTYRARRTHDAGLCAMAPGVEQIAVRRTPSGRDGVEIIPIGR